MRFSPQQDRALCAAASWLRARGAQVFRLFGYAGTGKTTLARHLAEHIDGRVLFAAYTGKAAQVMRAKGCNDAGTLHSLIYICTEIQDGPLFELTSQSPLAEAALLIVEECSMVDATLGNDILSFGADGDDDPKAHGFLFNDDSCVFGHGAIVGACEREYTDHPPCWAMQWIWIAPKARRRGILSRRWDAFRARFGKFVIEPPLSDAMQAFAAKQGVVDGVVK